jgi:hypothetical protein
MADQRITELGELTGAAADGDDRIEIVDRDDLTMASSGTNKQIKRSEFFKNLPTDLAIADGGTGASDVAGARSNLSVYSQAEVDALVNATAANVGKRARVRAATTANVTIASDLNNGDVIDGVTLSTNDLVLVKNQSAQAENGVYVVGTSPARFVEFDTYDEHPGSLIAAQEGTANADTLWLCTSNTGGTLGTTAIAFTKLVVAGELLAANNLSDVASASTARSNLGVTIGTDVQAYDADLGAIAALVSAANKLPYATGAGTWALTDLTAAGRALIDDADSSEQRSTLGIGSIGTYSAASLTTNGVVYGTGATAIGSTAAGTAGQALISGGSGAAPAYGAVVDRQYITTTGSNQTWTKPATATAVFVLLMGGGGSGGSGERVATVSGTNTGGGGGGASGSVSYAWYDASTLAATETVVVGAGGTAPAATTSNGAGATGNAGGATTFTVNGTVGLYAGGGGGGEGGGQTILGIGGNGGSGNTAGMYVGSTGGNGGSGGSNTAATAAGAGQVPGTGGGGGGGGGNTGGTIRAASAGGAAMAGTGTTGTGIAGGTTGNPGTQPAAIGNNGNVGYGNGGGGGGTGRNTNVAGGAGGAGGVPGGGGGGGGNGGNANGGAGGAGGRGFALIISYR